MSVARHSLGVIFKPSPLAFRVFMVAGWIGRPQSDRHRVSESRKPHATRAARRTLAALQLPGSLIQGFGHAHCNGRYACIVGRSRVSQS
jgi:hypothetical protein